MIVDVLLAVTAIVLAVVAPRPHAWIALTLSVVALFAAVLHWNPFH